MVSFLQILSDEERSKVHERTLKVLANTGVRVDTERGRQILRQAGAEVNENSQVVRFPRALVEESLRVTCKQFTLGGRRPGYQLPMNAGECSLVMDGEGVFAYDSKTGERRNSTMDDWLAATRLCDALDEVGVFWEIVEGGRSNNTIGDYAEYWRKVICNFSKHLQDSPFNPEETRWMLKILEVVFGGKEAMRKQNPFSFLVCPLSPLVIEKDYTDAYLETIGWQIPIAVMTMPLMGLTSPATLISTTIMFNAETIALLCLTQAAQPGTPFIYAAAPASMEPRYARFTGGGVENALLSSAVTEMARYYGLPVESTTGGSDAHAPGIQAAYERALNWAIPVLSWPDLLVGPGLLSGAMILSLEQLLLDVEVFRRCKRFHRGIDTQEEKWLDDLIDQIGPGGNFLKERSTHKALRSGEWYTGSLGITDPYERWEADNKADVLDRAKARVAKILAEYQPLPLDEAMEAEVEHIVQCARASDMS
jgi:trimethylamine--corrinoid protein Co-methyltransferase